MSRAPLVPALPAGAPVSVLVDYDGTVSRQDVGTVLLAEHALVDAAVVAAKDADYDAGRSGSRDLMQWDMEVLPRDGALLRTFAAEIPQDETFVSFVATVRDAGAAIEIVSDGLGFYVASNLARLDPTLIDLPVATNDNDVDGDGRLTFPYGHPACFVCGTCKRERVRAHEADGRVVVFIGDGSSDRYAAHHADIVFAKDALLAWGQATGRDFRAWDRFVEIEAWFVEALADGRLPATTADLPAWRATHRPLRPDFICGPEAWGKGRTVPDPLGGPPGDGPLSRNQETVVPATSKWTVIADCHDLLGEGPWWDARTETLLWVDIDGRRLARYDPASGRMVTRDLDQRASAVMGRATGGLALVMEDGLWVTDTDAGPVRRIAGIEPDDPLTRMNDASCDRLGRLWVGSMAHSARPGAGALYRVDLDGSVERVLVDVTISNGIDWSPDDRHMYFIDSATRRVDVLDYDLATGCPTGRRALIELPEGTGLPDGMTVDAEGYLWVALWDGWSVRRYSPSGDLDRIVWLPVARVTSCAFGGPNLSDLYITSASAGLSASELARQPLAGGLFVVQPGVRGLEATPFGG